MRRPLLASLMLALAACRGRGEERPSPRGSASTAPASVTSATPCAGRAFAAGDAEVSSWFPASVAALCVDRHGVPRRFGATGEPPLDAGCESVGLDCKELERLGLSRIVSLRYLDRRGAATEVLASVLSFGDAESAYGFFTARLSASAALGKPELRAFDAPGAAVLGDARALLVRGESVLSLELSDTKLPPDDVIRVAARVLPELTRAIGARLQGDVRPPPAMRALPAEYRERLSERYDALDLFGIVGIGRGARAQYDDAGKRYELAAATRPEPDAADDLLKTLRRLPGASKIKDGPYDALRSRLTSGQGAPTEWVFGRRGALVMGVGAVVEPTVSKQRGPKPPDEKVRMLKRLLDARRTVPD